MFVNKIVKVVDIFVPSKGIFFNTNDLNFDLRKTLKKVTKYLVWNFFPGFSGETLNFWLHKNISYEKNELEGWRSKYLSDEQN